MNGPLKGRSGCLRAACQRAVRRVLSFRQPGRLFRQPHCNGGLSKGGRFWAEHGVGAVRGILSPVGQSYHLKDDLASTADRLTMCELACSSSEWLSVDSWEASQSEYVRTGTVMDELARRLKGAPHQRPGGASSDAQVRLVCGADLLESMATPGVWTEESLASTFAHGLVVFGGGRGGAKIRRIVITYFG